MNFADLTDSEYIVSFDFAGDACDYWDYDLSLRRSGEKYSRNLSSMEVNQLRANCKRILNATDGIEGGY